MLPFTRDQFYAVFALYNQATWPAPALAGALGAFAVVWILRRRPSASLVASGTLGAMWLWTGAVYHFLFFARIDWLAYLFGLAFLAQGGLFAYYGLILRKLQFGLPRWWDALFGLLLIFYAAILYPVIGMKTGHSYPAMPIFGVAPCPVTIFTFGMLLLTTAKFPRGLLWIPLGWSIIGGAAAILLDVAQDWALPAAGLLATARLIQRDRALR